MEELLNKLIKKGWKPRGEEKIHSCRYHSEEKKFKADYTIAGIPQVLYRSIRELTSKESGLWQFCTENGMADDGTGVGWQKVEINKKGSIKRKNLKSWKGREEYEYRLIESALIDEDKLEEFLLNSIKVDG